MIFLFLLKFWSIDVCFVWVKMMNHNVLYDSVKSISILYTPCLATFFPVAQKVKFSITDLLTTYEQIRCSYGLVTPNNILKICRTITVKKYF